MLDEMAVCIENRYSTRHTYGCFSIAQIFPASEIVKTGKKTLEISTCESEKKNRSSFYKQPKLQPLQRLRVRI